MQKSCQPFVIHVQLTLWLRVSLRRRFNGWLLESELSLLGSLLRYLVLAQFFILDTHVVVKE